MTMLYLAGPMTGLPRYNFPAFATGASELRAAGFTVRSPAEHDLDDGFDPALPAEEQGFDVMLALLWDVESVIASDGVAVLPGWDQSVGATIEVEVALALGKPVREVAEWLDSTPQLALVVLA